MPSTESDEANCQRTTRKPAFVTSTSASRAADGLNSIEPHRVPQQTSAEDSRGDSALMQPLHSSRTTQAADDRTAFFFVMGIVLFCVLLGVGFTIYFAVQNKRLESKPRSMALRCRDRDPLVDRDAPSRTSNPNEQSNNASPTASAGERRVPLGTKEINHTLREALQSFVEKYANGTAPPDAALSPLLASFIESHPECAGDEFNQRTATTRAGSGFTAASSPSPAHALTASWSAQLVHELRQQQSCNSASSDTSDPVATSRARSARAALGHYLMPPPYTESPLASGGNSRSLECPVPLAPLPVAHSPPYTSVPQCEPLTVENLRAFVSQTQCASSTIAPRAAPPPGNGQEHRIAHSTPGLLRHNVHVVDEVGTADFMLSTRSPIFLAKKCLQTPALRHTFNGETDSLEPPTFLPSETLDAAERVSSMSESSAADLVIDLRPGAIAPNSTPTRLSSNPLHESGSNASGTCASDAPSFPPEPLNPPPTPNPVWSASNTDLSESLASAEQPIIINRLYIGPSITPPRESVQQQAPQVAPSACATRQKASPESGVLHLISPSSSLLSLSEQSPAHQAAARKALQELIEAGARASPQARGRASSHNACPTGVPKALAPAESARRSRSHSRGALEVDLLLPTQACHCAQHSPAACSSSVEPNATGEQHKHKRTKRDAILKSIARARALGLNESSSSSSSSALVPDTAVVGGAQAARQRASNRPYRRVRLSFFTSVPPPTPHASESDSTSEAPVVAVAATTPKAPTPAAIAVSRCSSSQQQPRTRGAVAAPTRSKPLSRSRCPITQPLRFKVAGCPFPLAREQIGEEQCEAALESGHVLFPAAVVSPGWSSASATTGPSSCSAAVSSATGPRGDRPGDACSTSPALSSISQSLASASASSIAPSSAQSGADRTAAPPFAVVGRSLPGQLLIPIANSQSSRAPREKDQVIEIARL